MRIAFVVAGGVDRSGRERVVPMLLWLIERLARRHEIHVFVLRHYPEPCTYDLRGATIHDLGRTRGPRGLRALRQLAPLVRALRGSGPFDVVHGLWALPSGLLASLAGWWLRIPRVVTFDSGELVCIPDIEYGQQCSWRGRLAVRVIARLSHLHVCSEHMAGLAKRTGLRAERIPIGAAAEAFQPGRGRAEGPPWRLLHVASLNRVKDQPMLLRAFGHIVGQRPGIHLDIVGEDTLNGSVQRVCEALHLSQHVTFHGFQPTDAMPQFYRVAHLLVMASRHEGSGMVVLEAAMCGVPTVGTAAGYVADWSPAAALAVPAGDDRALADAVLSLLDDPARRSAIADEASRRARAHDAHWSAAALERFYRSLS